MDIQLIGPLDYSKLAKFLDENGYDKDKIEDIINYVNDLVISRKSEIVSAAGRLSRFPGTVSEILKLSEEKTFEQNVNFIKRVCAMGHDSITDHDYCVFAIKNVTPIIEQVIIEERFSSFTIKSRREVNFGKSGHYIPIFRDCNYRCLENNVESFRSEYDRYADFLFKEYSKFVDKGLPKEDARFILPYSYYSNIIMGVDAHTLKDMIVKFTKTKYSKITELCEFGRRLYQISTKYMPYIVDEIDKMSIESQDSVDEFLSRNIIREKYRIIDHPILISHSNNVDDMILISSIMRRYQYSFEHAKKVYENACHINPNFKLELMRKIAFEGDRKEFAQVNFEYQIPLSYAVLTHLTRHRTHPIMVPDFISTDLSQYKIPPKIKNDENLLNQYEKIYSKNLEMYNKFKQYGICNEDLIYFILSGNMTNIVTNLDGMTLAHILNLRECVKTQWETRDMSKGLHDEIKHLDSAKLFSSVLGPSCETQGFCKEGKESCGKILNLKK